MARDALTSGLVRLAERYQHGRRQGIAAVLDQWVSDSVAVFRWNRDVYRNLVKGTLILGAAIGALVTLWIVFFAWLVLR
jgi:hypothetical protein